MENIATVVGVVLWWAEGTKSRRDKRWKNAVTYPLEMTSTDPLAIKIFLEFVRKDLGVEESRLKLQIQVHKNDDVGRLEKYWTKITKIPKSRFQKTIIRPIGNKPGKTNGTCKIRYHDKLTYLKASGILKSILEKTQDIKNRGVAQSGSARRLGR